MHSDAQDKTIDNVICKNEERGAALAIVLIVLVLLFAISMSVLATVSTEIGIASSDLSEKPAFYAALSGIEKMKNDILDHFSTSPIAPTSDQLKNISGETDPDESGPKELRDEGYSFKQKITSNDEYINQLLKTGKYGGGAYPMVKIPASRELGGLYGSLASFKLSSTATHDISAASVTVEQTINSYMIPLFQFGIFSNNDLEIYPGPKFVLNGRVHTNGDLYTNGESILSFLNKVTYVGTLYRPSSSDPNNKTKGPLRNGTFRDGSVKFDVAPQRLAKPLKLPVQNKYPAREVIKRSIESDVKDEVLKLSRYHYKAQIRILIDDETSTNSNVLSDTYGVKLSEFLPSQLGAEKGDVLRRINDDGTFADSKPLLQVKPDSTDASKKTVTKNDIASTVRSTRSSSYSSADSFIPRGAGLAGKIRIQIVTPEGNIKDVTQTILSMGVTEGEPNGIIYLQRPIWAAFIQGSRDRYANSDRNNSLTNLISNTGYVADGEIKDFSLSGIGTLAANTNKLDDDANDSGINGISSSEFPMRFDDPTYNPGSSSSPRWWNDIVPINVYNVREGWIHSQLNRYELYERGLTRVIEINMKNLSRWLDGVYDKSLLAGTGAESSNIGSSNGYIVYVSDRRGDRNNNGIVDNEDVYGSVSGGNWSGGTLDDGEDVIDDGSNKGTLQKDTNELPNPTIIFGSVDNMVDRAREVAKWKNNSNYFRNAVRLFNGETLQLSGSTGKLSKTKGITVATENMVYIWGSYNTTGISSDPGGNATLSSGYNGPQIPASIVADAFFPLSKTWFDSYSAIKPEGGRFADEGSTITNETSVRAAIIAGDTKSGTKGLPDNGNGEESRLNGGIQNYPRFLEYWKDKRWNYIGSFIPLFHSTQAVGQYSTIYNVIYHPPIRNWAFDTSYEDPMRLPPGTPSFQYIEVTSFKQVVPEKS